MSNPGSDRSSGKVVQADFPGWEGAGVDLWSDISAGMAGRAEFAPLAHGLDTLEPQTADPLRQLQPLLCTLQLLLKNYWFLSPASLPPPGRAPEQPHDNVLVSSFLFKEKNPTKKPTNLISCSGEPYITDAPICAVCL